MEYNSLITEELMRVIYASELCDKEEVLLDLDSRKVVRRKYTQLGQLKFSLKDSFEVSEEGSFVRLRSGTTRRAACFEKLGLQGRGFSCPRGFCAFTFSRVWN